MDYLPRGEFRRCVKHYGGDKYIKRFSCWSQFLSMAFAQLTYRESLRDIETCMEALGSKLYHAGIRTGWSSPRFMDTELSQHHVLLFKGHG